MANGEDRDIFELERLHEQIVEAKRTGVDVIYKPLTWKEKLTWKISQWLGRSTTHDDFGSHSPELQDKERLLYNTMMKDIEASDIDPAIKEGLDPLPVMIGYLLAAAGGGAISMILGSLLAPYIQAKLTYPLNKMAVPYRFTPDLVIALTRRKYQPELEETDFWNDLGDQGMSTERVLAVKELVKQIPPLSDMIRFADFSAFDPEVIEKWKDYYEAPEWLKPPLELVGIFDDWANKYWFSHYVQPGRFELAEMHRRGLVSDDDVLLAYRTQAYSEFWQPKLLELVRAVPTRVDVRRWWDMATIDEERLRQIYQAQGYYNQDLDDYVLWTKVYVAFPDLIARYRNGWITEADVRNELTTLGMPEERVEIMLQTKFKKPVAEERVAETTKLTRALIIKGAKEGRLNRQQTLELLMRKNYEAWEAEYIYDIEVTAAASPETPLEFRVLVEAYRKSQGLEFITIPPELLEAERQYKKKEVMLREAEDTLAAQEVIDQLQAEAAILKTKFEDMAALYSLTPPQGK